MNVKVLNFMQSVSRDWLSVKSADPIVMPNIGMNKPLIGTNPNSKGQAEQVGVAV
jgi:hypothetical protein